MIINSKNNSTYVCKVYDFQFKSMQKKNLAAFYKIQFLEEITVSPFFYFFQSFQILTSVVPKVRQNNMAEFLIQDIKNYDSPANYQPHIQYLLLL